MSKAEKQYIPWEFLNEFRGIDFKGEWPTVPEMFAITAKRFGARACLSDFENPDGGKRTFSYMKAERLVLTLAAWFSGNGVKKDDRIALSGKNSPEWTVVFLAALYVGAVICPLDYALRDEEMENLLGTAKPKFLFIDEEKYSHFAYAKAPFPFQTFSLCPKFADAYVLGLSSDNATALTMPQENDLAAILFTSGTTGTPKGVMLTHKNLVSDCYIAQTRMHLYETDVFYALLPLHHAYTMQAVMLEALSVGAEIVYGKSMAVTRLMKELKEGKITMLLGVPLLFNKLLAGILKGIRAKGPIVYGAIKLLLAVSYLVKKLFRVNVGKKLFKSVLAKAKIQSLRIAICGGGPLADSVFKIYNEMGIDFVQGYGLTETSPIITLNPVDHFKIESVGQYFFPYMEMKILNPSADGIGEVAVKGPMVFSGYYMLEEETKKVFTEDGFFKTGDLGWLDGEGYLMLSGRVKNMIVTSGGKNVYPEEIENAFQLCTDIQQITVQGYLAENSKTDEEIEALIYPSDDLFDRLHLKRETDSDAPQLVAEINAAVERVNRTLQPYARITKTTLLAQPLEMTTTQKVKRKYN